MKLAPVSLLLGLAVAGPAAVQAFGQKYERIYFGAWNLGAECGSNALPGCRDAAVTFLTATTTAGYSPGEAAILMTVGLVDDAGSPIDLTNQGKLASQSLFFSNCFFSQHIATFRHGANICLIWICV